MIYTKIGSYDHGLELLTKLEAYTSVTWVSGSLPTRDESAAVFITPSYLVFTIDSGLFFLRKKVPELKLVTPNAFIDFVARACPKEKD
jgi:hypothetical protein